MKRGILNDKDAPVVKKKKMVLEDTKSAEMLVQQLQNVK